MLVTDHQLRDEEARARTEINLRETDHETCAKPTNSDCCGWAPRVIGEAANDDTAAALC